MKNQIFLMLALLAAVLCGCSPTSCLLEPKVEFSPHPWQITSLPPAFEKLSPQELAQEWGKEYLIGVSFAHEMDLYRAITSFKRALFIMPSNCRPRKQEVEYYLLFCYYLGKKYKEAIEIFETSSLGDVPCTFPAFHDLSIILYESYQKIGNLEKADRMLKFIETGDKELSSSLSLSSAVQTADFKALTEPSSEQPCPSPVYSFLDEYRLQSKSVRKAQILNAILPGAGFLYVGQKKTALTSFIINTLFTSAAYYFYRNNNIPMGLILTSLETGWYIGGINGAGLAAKEYNERLYENKSRDWLLSNRLFPVLMLQTSF